MGPNLYRIDDVLLRAGGASLLLVLAAAAIVVVAGLTAEPTIDGRAPGWAAVARHGPLLALASLGPAALLGAGFTVRRREKRMFAIWTLLKRNAEIHVPGLLANSDFERRDLERAVRFLNNRGFGHYVWNRNTDTIQDAYLQSAYLQVDKCDACGAAVPLDVPISSREIPRCPFCHDPVSAEGLWERRREAIETLRAEGRPASGPRGYRPEAMPTFSVALFLLLLFAFWPAALVYAWCKWQGRF